ncbi:Gamma-glutamyl-gamma-aminobutyrate hydrolase family protein, partial [Dysosmobacter welbionis]
AVGQVLLRSLQLLPGSVQVLLDGEELALALLPVDAHQHLAGRHLQVVHQIAGNHRAIHRGNQVAGAVVRQLASLIGVHGLTVHSGGGRGHHIRRQGSLILHDNVGGEELGPLRRDAADHVDRLHRAGNGGHQGRDRNIHRLSHLQVARIGVAVILLQPQTGIVGEDRHLLALGDGITGIQRHGLHQLAGIAGGEIQSCDVFLGLGELFLIALHIAPGLLHGGLCRRRVDGEQRRAG